MKKVLLMNKISPVGLEMLDSSKYLVGAEIENPDAIMVRSAKLGEMQFPSSLAAIVRSGAGVNNIPVERCTKDGIVVFNTPGANANGVKELAICALVLASRDVIGGVEFVNGLSGSDDIAKAVESGKAAFVGHELVGKTLGVIGLGAIGGMVANAASALGMNVVGCDPYITTRAAWSLAPSVKQANTYDEIFEKCDYITLHVPATAQTKGMISDTAIAKMRHGVRIINLARADLVDAAAIKRGIEEGRIAKYVTDFPTAETVGVKGIVNIPHLGASTFESEDHCAVMAAKQLDEYLTNGNIVNSVNFPSVSLPHTSGARACVMHKNVPNMLSQITAAFSSEGVNIDNLANGSKGEVAYTIVEVTEKPSEGVLNKLREIEGIIKIRLY